MLSKFSLENKVAIVTGCNTGLGQGIALAMAGAGAKVFGVNVVDATETAEMMKEQGHTFHNFTADISASDSPARIMDEVIKTYGQADILVNNAGIIRRADAVEFTEKDWDDVMNINIKSVFFMSQAFARYLIDKELPGNIINIASMLSFQGGIRVPSYTASKSGVMGLTRLLANEWAAKGINVNAIAPGYMATNNTEALRNDAERSAEILGRIPAARWGLPEDVGGPAVFLASDASRYINGYTLAVDGGWLAR